MNLVYSIRMALLMFRGFGVLPIEWHLLENGESDVKIRSSKVFRYYSNVLISISLVLIMYSLPHWYNNLINDDDQSGRSRTSNFTYFIIVVIFFLTGLTTFKVSVLNHKEILIFLNTFIKIANKISKQDFFSTLHIKINIYLVIYLFITIVTVIYEPFMWPPEENRLQNLIGFIAVRTVSISNEQQFLVFGFIVRKLIFNLNSKLEHATLHGQVQGNKYTIKELREMYITMWEQTRILNTVYELPLLMWITGQVLDILVGVFYFLVALLNPDRSEVDTLHQIIGVLSWTPLVIIRNFALCWIGAHVKGEVQRLSNILHKISETTDTQSTLDEIHIFIDLLQHQRIEFQVFGIFSLDYELMYNIYGAVTTDLAILLQFQLASAKQ